VSLIDLIVPMSHFEHFKILDVYTSINLIMDNVWIKLVSDIWKHRNNYLFKGEVVDHTKVFSLTYVKASSWISSKILSVSFLFFD